MFHIAQKHKALADLRYRRQLCRIVLKAFEKFISTGIQETTSGMNGRLSAESDTETKLNWWKLQYKASLV
jgi:hypothetical protein